MSYRLHEMSERCRKMKVLRPVGKVPIPTYLKRDFPFMKMQPGHSFYLRFDETTPYVRAVARERINRFNREYACFFVAVLHTDFPKRLEIARLV